VWFRGGELKFHTDTSSTYLPQWDFELICLHHVHKPDKTALCSNLGHKVHHVRRSRTSLTRKCGHKRTAANRLRTPESSIRRYDDTIQTVMSRPLFLGVYFILMKYTRALVSEVQYDTLILFNLFNTRISSRLNCFSYCIGIYFRQIQSPLCATRL